MIKRVFFTAALLVPSLACSANPSANLTVQVDPAVPAEAAAAGFTTLAANYDFTQPLYATQSNWLDCANSNGSLPWHNQGPGYRTPLPCNVNQVVDAITSGNVIDIAKLKQYDSLGRTNLNNGIPMQTSINTGTSQTGTVYFPNLYMEVYVRQGNLFGCSNNAEGSVSAVWLWGTIAPGDSQQMEIDAPEMSACGAGYATFNVGNHQNGRGCGICWASFNANNLPAGFSIGAWHKYGTLITSDGSTAAYVCSWVDDVFQLCNNPSYDPGQFTQRMILVADSAAFANPSAGDVHTLIEYIRVWSCANWQGVPSDAANMCFGSTLFNSGGLTYWH